MKKKKQKQEKQRKKRKGHRLYAFTTLTLAIAIVILSVGLLCYVQKITVKGNEYTSSQEIVDFIKEDPYSGNSLYVYWKYHYTDYKMPGCMESMKVSVENPWTIRVDVKEKQIVGYVLDNDAYAYFDKNGQVVLRGSKVIEGVPGIEGLGIGKTKLYEKIETGDGKIFDQILELTTQLDAFSLVPDRIRCLDGEIYLYFQGICIDLGKKITVDKMAQIQPVLEKLAGQTGTVHLEHYQDANNSVTFKVGELPPEEQ